jgi:hypothetical protein
MMVTTVSTPRKLWEHPDPRSTAMWKFMQEANAKRGLQMQVCLSPWIGLDGSEARNEGDTEILRFSIALSSGHES